MTLATLVLAAAIAALPAQQPASNDDPPKIDFDRAIAEASARIVAEDLGLQVVARPPMTAAEQAEKDAEPGYLRMTAQGMTHYPELLFVGMSALDIYSKQELQNVCTSNPYVTCDAGWPESASMDAAITAGVYAGVVGIQRLSKKYWDVDLDDGWKEILLWGGMATVRGFLAWDQMQDANAVREFGR